MSGRTTFGIQGRKVIEDELNDEPEWIMKTLNLRQVDRELERENIRLPDFQRDKVLGKAKAIAEAVKQNHMNKKTHTLVGDSIKIGNYNEINWVIDGQHRLTAIRRLVKKYQKNDELKILDTKILLVIIKFKNRKETLEYYNQINKDRKEIPPNNQALKDIFKDGGYLTCDSDSDSE